ncbi:MAG: protein-L-isoaspartate O-methyltransferase family protein [Geminicoccaceae bacterium]
MNTVQARTNMVDNQLRTNRVDDPEVLEAMGTVPRELFLPKALHGVAYADEDLHLPNGQFLVEPLVFARLLQAAAIRRDDIALVVGCDTGYAAAVTSKLAATVIFIQQSEDAAARIQPILDQLEADNVVTSVHADPAGGDPDQAPYNVIIVIGVVDTIPEALIDQLNDDGRLVAVEGRGRVGKGVLVTKIRGMAARNELFDAHSPDFRGVQTTAEFAF